MKKVKLSITGMHCDECENSIKNALNMEGILEKNANYKTGDAIVCFNPQQISEASIAAAIKNTGKYQVVACNEC